MMNTKTTKKEYFEMISEIVANSKNSNKEEIQSFIEHEIELLSRKSSKTTMTQTQKENITIMETIKEVLTTMSEDAVTITELQKMSIDLSQYSNQKLSALLKKLVESGDVVKTMNKKKAYFSLTK